ncbi:MAG: NUDIX domain-containing protein [Alphaproteobacteria bacterium]|nr:MAG: NUDIX domain-containing protein [Alphaproteobacteria bacterium]
MTRLLCCIIVPYLYSSLMPQKVKTDDKVKILAQNTAYGGYARVEKFDLQFRLYDGEWSRPVSREIVYRGEAAVVIPYDPQKDMVLMIEQFRLPALCKNMDPWLTELPAGMVEDSSESIESVAAREMMEETGLGITHLRHLHSFLPSPGVLAETLHLFVGKVDLSPLDNGHGMYHGAREEDEDIKLCPMPLSDVPNLLKQDKIKNASSMLGLYWLLLHRDELRKEWKS